MKQIRNIIRYTISFLILLFISIETICGQNFEIQLNEGCDNNPPIQLDDLIVESVNFIINHKPWDGRNPSQEVILKMMLSNESHTMYMRYYETNNDQCRNSYPKAIDKYLFDLNVGENKTDLLIRTLKIGDEFMIDPKPNQYIIIENITLTYSFGLSATLLNYKHKYGGYEISHSFKVSDNEDEGNLEFSFVKNGDTIENEGIQEWKDYRFEILNNFEEPLKIKVSKLTNKDDTIDA